MYLPVYSRSDIFANEKRRVRRALVADSEAFLGGGRQRVGVVHKFIDCYCWVTSFYNKITRAIERPVSSSASARRAENHTTNDRFWR